jgi:AcrR family transcriptional regulator
MKKTRVYTSVRRSDAIRATRERIIRAAVDLFFESPYEEVTLVDIAGRAAVSHQTVLNHFESKEGVFVAAAALIADETFVVRDSAKVGDVADVVRVLVGEYERFGDTNFRWAATADRLGDLAVLLDGARLRHQEWLGRMFPGRIPSSPARRRRALAALHAATDIYTWKLFRRDLRLSRSDTETAMAALVAGVLSASD